MRKRDLWMIIGCVLPLLLIFILPAFGIGSGGSIFILIIFMFACHLFMMRRHGEQHGDERHGEHDENKWERHSEQGERKEAGHGCH